MPLCTITVGVAAFENLLLFQMVQARNESCLFAVRELFVAHLLIAWALIAFRQPSLAWQTDDARLDPFLEDEGDRTPSGGDMAWRD
jgi:hypothetical protein